MPYVPHSENTVREMLAVAGAGSVDELYAAVPATLLRTQLGLPCALAEPQLVSMMEDLAAGNNTRLLSFLGAGYYDHYIPAAVPHLVFQSQFYTAYTPYQPEVSQGTLALIYEFQTYVATLTGMDVANASMYDGATAAAEAALMALRIRNDRRRVLLAPNVHPHYRDVVATYLSHIPGMEAVNVSCCAPYEKTGTVDLNRLAGALEGAACFVMQYPNFYGLVETRIAEVAEMVHAAGALLVVITNPMALAVLEAPGKLGADICVGEGQPFGIPLSYGGPGVGFFAARDEYVRQMPGRIVGRTVDREGKPAYVLTLQTREQHIRREKATSNICSNHALGAATFTIYLSVVGRSGLVNIARQNVANAAYAQYQCSRLKGYKLVFEEAVFNEFALHCPKPAEDVRRACRRLGVDPGVPLGKFFPEYKDVLLIAVTEKRTKDDVDKLCSALAQA